MKNCGGAQAPLAPPVSGGGTCSLRFFKYCIFFFAFLDTPHMLEFFSHFSCRLRSWWWEFRTRLTLALGGRKSPDLLLLPALSPESGLLPLPSGWGLLCEEACRFSTDGPGLSSLKKVVDFSCPDRFLFAFSFPLGCCAGDCCRLGDEGKCCGLLLFCVWDHSKSTYARKGGGVYPKSV